MNASDRGRRLARLDGLRGLAAAGVLLYHLANWPGLPVTLGWSAGWVFRSGWTLVDLFFVLSGYVLAHVYGAPGALRAPGAMTAFWGARIARLWPLHLFTLGLFALFAWGGGNSLPHLVAHAFMLQGLDPATARSFNSASWSLTIEMLCYGVFCLGAWLGDRPLMWVTVLAVVGCGWWLAVLGHPGGPWFGETLPRGMFGFFMGQLLWRTRDHGRRIPTMALVAAMTIGLWLDDGTISPVAPLGFLTWPAAVLLALRWPVMESRPMHWLGQRSFGIYMMHMLAIHAIDALRPPHALGWLGFLTGQTSIVVLTLLAAEASYWSLEMPGRRIIRAGFAAWHGRILSPDGAGITAGA
jgi:peptidoglycan/LPS O-acetylase OafA/YrhL